jgi:hypothetical protein
MKMKKILQVFILTALVSGLIMLSSCKKLLVIPPNAPDQLETSLLFADSATAVQGILGMYSSNFDAMGGLSGLVTLYPALSADELIGSHGSLAEISDNAIIPGTPQSPGGVTGDLWNSYYGNTTIYQANAAIEGLNKSKSLSASFKNQLIGECKVVRAISFFNLANVYGPVPLPTSTDYTVNAKLPRLPVDSTFAHAAADLSDAAKRLTEMYPSDGRARPNKYTALAYLSKVYLYQKNYTAALAAANEVINSGLYSLETLDGVFLEGSNEGIWQAANVGPEYLTKEGAKFVPSRSNVAPTFVLTDKLLKAFESGDARRTAWVKSTTVSGTTYYYPYKYKNGQAGQVTTVNEQYMMIRLAEVYLIRAEAELQLGNLSSAADDINVIRTRAALPSTTASTKDDLMAAVMQERRIEMFCEWGNRWYDLKRTGTANLILSQEKPLWPADGHALLYPIPLGQLRLNPTWKQNPGY